MSTRLGLAAVAVVVGVAAGCGHEVTSPTMSAQTVAPDLVCVEQLTTRVALTGDGFTPMPIDTMKGARHLVLPSVLLSRVKDLTDASASGDFPVPDDPLDASGSQVQWQSEQQMSFDVTPDLALEPGLYNVVVTNPDKRHGTVFAGGLAGVPRPTLSGVSADLICDAEKAQSLTLTGSGILKVGDTLPTVHVGIRGGAEKDYTASGVDGCTAVPGTHAEGTVLSCTSASFEIPQGDLPPGIYEVSLTNPAPADCVSTDVLTVTVVPPPTVTAIAPDLICDAQGDQTMHLTGTGFLTWGTTVPTITVGTATYAPTSVDGCEPLPGPVAESSVSTCTSMTFTIPAGDLQPGDYAVVVTNPPPADCYSTETINLHVAPPPTITGVDPLAICDAQGAQTITITGTGFLQAGDSLPAVTIGAQTFTPSSATGCTEVAGTFTEGTVKECTGLVVTVPQGTFTAGQYPVTVTNPAPADCHSTEAATLTIDDPPVVTGTLPATLCQGGGQIQVDGSGFLPGATVSLTASGQPTLQSSPTVVNGAGTQINATFGVGGIPGTQYDVIVDNGDGCSDAAPHRKVTVVTGPIAFFADPEVVYNGVNTRVTVYATTLQQPLPADAVTIVPTGQSSPVTTLTWAAVPGHPNRVQVIVPEGQGAGVYDLSLNDATGCATTLTGAITVTDTLSVTLKQIVPPFGYAQTETSVTIKRDTSAPPPANAPFVATPRVFLNPTNPQPTDIAIQVQSVSFVDGATLTAVVPKNQPVHAYDLIVVNPDRTVGLLADAFTVVATPPPTIASVTPSSIVNAAGQVVTVSGQHFSGSTITVSCVAADSTPESPPPVTSGSVSCGGTGCTQQATINATALSAGSICILRLTNADGTYFDYSAIGVTGSSLNTSAPHVGSPLKVGRRALVAAAGNATSSARFVYAIGGDGGAGAANAPFDSVEVASVDLYGTMGAWSLLPDATLRTPRSFAASATVGRYVYVYGGSDGAGALASGERAMILDPREVPQLDIDDLVPADAGLDPGYWLYRVSATFTGSDPDNPFGESLPSDEFIVKVPLFPGKKIQVVLAWTAPVDSLGAPLPNVAGYNVYRTPTVDGASGAEVLIATVGAASLTYTDDGSATPGTQPPLPQGSLGKWAALPDMGTARMGAAGAAAFDPTTPGTFYVYALLGKQAGTALASYEYLPVTIGANGHQTVGSGWTPGAHAAVAGRWQIGAWVVDATVQSNYSSTWIFIGGGLDAGGAAADSVEAGQVVAGGDLGTISDTPKDFTSNHAGYGVCAANQQLFVFGGQNAAPSAGAESTALFSNNNPNNMLAPPSTANNGWNSEGTAMTHGRYLMGSAVQSAFIFLVGGQTDEPSPASTTTELVIW